MGEFERELKNALNSKAQNILETEDLKSRLDDRIRREQDMSKKHYSFRKAVILAAAACMLLGAGVFASGKVAGLVSGFDGKTIGSKTTDFSKLSKEEGILGYQVQAVPQFSNGFKFKQMDVDKTYGLDEDGNLMKQYAYYNLHMIYEKENTSLYVDVCKPLESSTVKNVSAVKMAGEIKLTYSEDTYKWVPTGYELTPEDEENLKRDDYYISEGGEDAVTTSKVAHVNWVKDGIHYSIMGYDLPIGSEEMFTMAQEILEN